jgi:hypothetical protein
MNVRPDRLTADFVVAYLDVAVPMYDLELALLDLQMYLYQSLVIRLW